MHLTAFLIEFILDPALDWPVPENLAPEESALTMAPLQKA